MKNLLTMGVVSVLMLLIVRPATADMLTGDVYTKGFIAKFSDNGTTKDVYVSPMDVHNQTTGDNFAAFCGDFRVNTSDAFSSTGQEYGQHALDSSTLTIYSDFQKTAIDSLFGNVYDSTFNLDGTMLNETMAIALQICVWEILTEGSGVLDILDGTFQMVSNLNPDVLALVEDWMAALMGDTSWDLLGYDYTQYDIDVYVADGGTQASQTLIDVNPNSPVTPEPSTWAIFGVGLAGLAFAASKRRRERLFLQQA